MTRDFLLIDIPVFVPEYDENKEYGWNKFKDNLWDLLKNTTKGYCMYCYDSIWINGQRRGQIEHGIEKVNLPERLEDCVPNLGIACENCNMKYKKRGEMQRRLPPQSIKEFGEGECLRFSCKAPCDKFKKLRAEYMRKGKIMIQPFEARKADGGRSLRIQYDLYQCKYIPSRNCGEYDEEELAIIEGHIKQFALNGADRKNYELEKFCKNVIDNRCLMQGYEYNNLVVELFRKKLQGISMKEAINICKTIYPNVHYSNKVT